MFSRASSCFTSSPYPTLLAQLSANNISVSPSGLDKGYALFSFFTSVRVFSAISQAWLRYSSQPVENTAFLSSISSSIKTLITSGFQIPCFSFTVRILVTASLILSSEIFPSFTSFTVSSTALSVCSNSFELFTPGRISISAPALMVMQRTSSNSKLFAIAAISSASVTTTPSKPISPFNMSVRIVLLMVAGI